MRTRSTSGFEWRGNFGSLRWLILGTLGVGHACGGRTDSEGLSGESGRDNTSAQSGTGGSSMTSSAGAAGPGNAGAFAATAGSTGLVGVAGAGGSATSSQPSACVFEASLEGGMERCQNGMLHRVAAGSCPSTLPRTGTQVSPERYPEDAGPLHACRQDGDCSDEPHGHCESGQGGPYCDYGCTTDSDCAADQLCLCGSPVGTCVPSDCRTDADCAGDALCAGIEGCYGSMTFACQTAGDQCAATSDCSVLESCVLTLNLDNPLASGQPPRVCRAVSCGVIGRPFLVHGTERLAAAVARADWYGERNAARADGITPELARTIAAGWTEQALMEHASVAAFARFALQLLSLGAPAQLLSDTTRAMQDEIRHARDCFRLARRHSAQDMGPGPLPVHGALAETSLCEVVLTTVREGCIGETVAALEATEALAHCEDAEARAVLQRIAVEEGQHAQLAWRFVAWALETAPHADRPRLLASIEAVFAAEWSATADASTVSEREQELARHGLLSAGVRQVLRQRAMAEVVAPCAEALLATARSRPLGAGAGSTEHRLPQAEGHSS